MTTARCRTLSSSVGIPMGRVSVVEPPLGMCTRRTGGARYVPDLARFKSDLEVLLQVPLVAVPGLSVHARRPVFAGPVEGRFQPVDVHQVGQRSEGHLRRSSRQLGYPLLFRVIRTSNLQVSVVFLNNDSMLPMPRFPPRGPHGRLFPRFIGTIKALRLPAVPPAALRCLRLAVPRDHAFVSLPRRPVRPPGLGLFTRYPRPGCFAVETTGSPKFLGNPDSRLHMFSTPAGRRVSRPLRRRCVAPGTERAKAPAKGLSRLNSMAFGLAAYASHCGLPAPHARLASRCWSGSPGRASHPQGSAKRFQS